MSSLAKLKGEGRSFWNGKAWTYPINYLLHMVVIIPTPENKEHPTNFQNKSVSSPFSRVTRYILFLAKLKGEEGFFEGCKKGGHIVRLPQEHLTVIRHGKLSSFVKFEIILTLL